MASSGSTDATGVRALLRALAVGLSVHLLYRDNPGASSFADACERIRAATRDALTVDGPLRVEVRSGRFVVDGELITGPGLDRLAHACFERRVELVRFEDVPSVAELRLWFELLGTDVAEVEKGGGMAALLQDQGVTAIVTVARGPVPGSGEDTELGSDVVGAADHADEDDGPRSPGLSFTAEPDRLRPAPGETGPMLYDRLQRWSTELSDDASARSSFYQQAARAVDALPRAERAVFGITLFDRVTDELFAERYVSHLTDVSLADLVADVAWFLGRDPAQLAAEVATAARRHATLPGLFATTSTSRFSPEDRDDTRAPPDDAVLHDGFPDGDAEQRSLAASALADVLLNDPRDDQLTGILGNVTEQLRACVLAGRPEPIAELLAALDRAAQAGPSRLATRLAAPRARSLDAELVAEAVQAAAGSGRAFEPRLLAPFETHAIAPLIAALAEAIDAPTAPPLLDALAVVGQRQVGVVAASLDRLPPEHVIRVIRPVGRATGVDTVSVLSALSSRAQPPVLRAVVDALVHEPPERAAPVLARIVRRAPAADLRNRALDALAALPDAAGVAQLEALAARGGVPRLPRRSRRRARRLARKAGRRP